VTQHTIKSIEVVKPGSPPDIDTDYNTVHREAVIERTSATYGRNKSARIVTHGFLKAKSAFKDIASIYGMPFQETNRISALLPGTKDGKECSLAEVFNPESERYPEGAEFRDAVSGPEWEKVVEGALAVEGRTKSIGTHACGVILSSHPLSDVIPVSRDNKQNALTEYEYPACENLGLIKIDFLGLDTVDIIQNTVQAIIDAGKEPPCMPEIIAGNMDDKKTYAMLAAGHTIAVFQLSSPGVQELLRKMNPTEVDHIAAITALYRPGPMSMNAHTKYADRIGGREPIEPIHPEFKGTVLDDILEPTASLIVYQEQVIEIAQKICGMTEQEGDMLRKAIGKKKTDVMMSMQPKFLQGGQDNGYSLEAMNILWEKVVEFSKYAFNKCLYGRTKILTDESTKIKVEDLYKRWERGEHDIKIMSMKEDGSFGLHRVAEIVKTGVKPLWTVKTASGRSIRITEDHRMLTTDGYHTVKDGGLAVGVELIHDPNWTKRISNDVRRMRSAYITRYNKSDQNKEKAKEWMTYYQSTLSFEDRSKHQKRIAQMHPERGIKVVQHMHEALRELWSKNNTEGNKDSGSIKRKKYGNPTVMDDGRIADSLCEAVAGNYLLARGVDFEIHKTFTSVNGTTRITDFYADGLYFEMDGLRRGRQWFIDNKYGNDIPFVYLTPENYRDEIDAALMRHHIENGDPIVEIVPPKILKNGSVLREMTYDIMMADDGPANFIANGLVSHNSHSYSYSILAYQTAYLKANYPVEFMATCLEQTLSSGNKQRRFEYAKEAERMGITFESINVNASGSKIKANPHKPNSILYGFSGVEHVSQEAADTIVQERETAGQFTSVEDFILRCHKAGVTNKKIFENIALAGGFDGFGASRKQVYEAVPDILSGAKRQLADTDNIFAGFDDLDTGSEDYTGEDFAFLSRLQLEGSKVGMYLSAHPLSKIKKRIPNLRTTTIGELMKSTRPTSGLIMCAVSSIVTETRGGRKTTTYGLEDGTGYFTARPSRDLADAMNMWEKQQDVKKAYVAGKTFVSDVTRSTVLMNRAAVPALEAHNVYSLSVTFYPPSGDSSGFVRINTARRVPMASDGTLPVRVRFDVAGIRDVEGYVSRIATSLKERFAAQDGKPIWYTIYNSNDTSIGVDSPAVYIDALNDLDSPAKDGTRSWPPPRTQQPEAYQMAYPALADALTYREAVTRVAVSNSFEVTLGGYVDFADYDFGVFRELPQ
jgi:DNA polymerase III, alpha subunit